MKLQGIQEASQLSKLGCLTFRGRTSFKILALKGDSIVKTPPFFIFFLYPRAGGNGGFVFLRTWDFELELSACFFFSTPFTPRRLKTDVHLVEDKLSSSWHLKLVGLCLLTLTRLEVTKRELDEITRNSIKKVNQATISKSFNVKN